MRFALKSKGIDLTAAINAAVAKSVSSIEKKVARFGESVTCEVEVSKTTKHHKKGDVFRAEVHVRVPGKLVYAESLKDDLYVAINDARKEAERQIADIKGARAEKVRIAKKTKGGRA